MEEQWEDVLLEMDKKFQSYALGKYQSSTQTTIKQEPYELIQQQQQQQQDIKPNIQQLHDNNNNNNDEESTSSLLHDFLQLFSLGYCTNHFKTFFMN
jgi:hypothetical protein